VRSFARFALLLSTGLAAGLAQTPVANAPLTGCVMTTEAGDFTFCEPDNCSVLIGKDVNAKLSGRSVTLRATIQAATAATPRTLTVTSIVSIGAACNQSCSPRPPGHRGIGGREHPGSEGGTPGLRPATPTPQ
jgi:hypothetical protein